MKKLNPVGWIALILLIIGGLNWALVGVFEWNLVEKVFGGAPTVVKVIYIVVGVAALYILLSLIVGCKPCKPEAKGPTEGQQ